MKKILPPLVLAFSAFFTACTTPPEEYFNTAILSSNLLHGFANEIDWRELESPSVKMVGTSGETAPMKRTEIVQYKIERAEEYLEKINDLDETPETKELIGASKEMYTRALTGYKNEYKQLAKFYDEGASKEQIQATVQSIQDKYAPKHAELHAKLIALGKVYAKQHKINVMWDIQTSPQ